MSDSDSVSNVSGWVTFEGITRACRQLTPEEVLEMNSAEAQRVLLFSQIDRQSFEERRLAVKKRLASGY